MMKLRKQHNGNASAFQNLQPNTGNSPSNDNEYLWNITTYSNSYIQKLTRLGLVMGWVELEPC